MTEKMQANSGTQAAAFDMLMSSIGSLLTPVVQQLINSDPGLVHLKGWHGMTALHRACLIGDYNIILMLIQANSDVNALTDFNETPLHYASKRGIPTIVHLLLQCGAKYEMKDDHGRRALHHAAESGAVQVFRYFEDAFQVNTRELDNNSMSPLHIACSHGHVELFLYLMMKGRSDLRQEDSEGNLAIHIAAKAGFGNMTWQMLKILGVSVLKKRNKAGYTMLDLVQQNDRHGNRELAPVLKHYADKPEHTKVDGPVYTWYFLLLYPAVLYTVLITIIQQLSSYQYVVLLVGMLQVWIQMKGLSHRIPDISRWPNPFFTGFFYGGILHTTICYFWLLFPKGYTNLLVLLLSVTLCPMLHVVFFRLLLTDPASVASTAFNPRTGKPLTIIDLCMTRNPQYRFCTYCDIITSLNVKHCKLCDKCYYRMDHHCLYLLKCVAGDNHPRFVWLIILGFCNMVCYCIGFCIYVYMLYWGQSMADTFTSLIHHEAWPMSLFFLNTCSAAWCASLIHYQFDVVTRECTSYFSETNDTYFKMTRMQKVENFVHFLLSKPLPHKNPSSPFGNQKAVGEIV
ncbi:putative ZDHHC-type palmitoyltransferase 6 [Aplysia californica]|uniref:Palmitoyltransferase n=1 Tax=Aplysia californica TaxID=6500 RepID=A0ABM0JTT9_APLCA|nr:putative ZDHHC-type palmitoyltransferase 6 [Aplysia californica]